MIAETTIDREQVMSISNEEELGAALKRGSDTIEIEGDLMKKVLRIKATGTVSWAIAIGAIGVAAAIAIGSGGIGAAVAGAFGVSAVSILGYSAAVSALSIAIEAGGVGALNSLRSYKVASKSDCRLVLKRS